MIALILLLLVPGVTFPHGVTQAPAAPTTRTLITVTVPADDAELEIDGKAIAGTGRSRSFETPPLVRGRSYKYEVIARWAPNTYTNMTRTKIVTFRAGERLKIDLSVDDPTDRVVVRYVPTPEQVALEMVRLAGVTANDVTYEPGCGDARITIAAVRSGARRGVGVDLDPERVTESRANVEAAGLGDRIEIRLGDALDQPDLGSMTVVFLYMGDHFNMLIRPYLWKQLPVGARVVSHRFLMGDWKPDKTVSVEGEYGEPYELHLWTITQAHKRQAARAAGAAAPRIVGTWELMTRTVTRSDGTTIVDPVLGEKPSGRLVYDASGAMMLQMMRTGRKATISTPGDARNQSNPRVILGYDSYFGRYTVDEKAGTVTHHVEGSLFPEDLGSDWVRPFTLEGDRLTLRLTSADGLTRTLIFQRMR